MGVKSEITQLEKRLEEIDHKIDVIRSEGDKKIAKLEKEAEEILKKLEAKRTCL